MKEYIKNTFLDLVRFDTGSDPESGDFPSSESLSDFAEILAMKLTELGLEEINIDAHSYLTATLPANTDKPCRTVGFIAHTDTSPDFCGHMIKPVIHENYDGSDIALKNNITIGKKDFPFLGDHIGKTIISADGTTLLGADDKAGITEILAALRYLSEHPEIKHGRVRAAFTPDEEIGRGVDFFDVDGFGCDFAYTVDGGELGELSWENFNAASAKISIRGKNVHPGTAKNIMKNAGLIAAELSGLLPENETPAHTDGYEGFFHLCEISGNVSEAHMEYIIRDFDRKSFENRKRLIGSAVEKINEKYGSGTVSLEIKDSYYNMKEIIDQHPEVIETAKKAVELSGVRPKISPTRGGTDGCRLSFMGLPCPNLFTGGYNFHGPFEIVVLESMEKAAQTIVNIIRLTEERGDRDV